MIERLSHTKIVLFLLVSSYFLLMAGNGIVTLTHPDEVFYIQTAKEMILHNSWATPYIFDQPQFEKPIFTYWLLVLAIKWFGLTAFGARFWPAFFGIMGVMLTYWFSFLLLEKKRISFLSSAILATSLIYLALSRAVLTDMIFSIWVTLALMFFYYGFTRPQRKSMSIILCLVFSGIAVLTKGILGFAFPASIISAFLVFKKKTDYFANNATLIGLISFAVIVLPWHILMYKMYGQVFTHEYFHNVHIRRILEAEHQRSNTWYFYPLTIFAGVFPWSLFLFPAGYLCSQLIRRNDESRDKVLFLIFWVSLVVFIMQIAQSKLASYILPVFPAVAIILGYYFDKILMTENNNLQKWFNIIANLMGFFLMAAAIAVVVAAKKYIDFVVDLKPVYVASALFFALSIIIFFSNYRKKYVGSLRALFSVTGIILIFIFLGHHLAEPWVSCQKICDAFKKIDRSDSMVLCSKFYARGVRFYTDRKIAVMDHNGKGFFSSHPIPFLNTQDKVLNFLSTQRQTYCILEKGDVEDLERALNKSFSVSHLTEIGGKYLLVVKKI